MSAVLITAATADVVSRDEVKRHLRVEHDDDNATIDELIAAAVGSLDPASGGWLGRALRPQTWELRACEFDPCPVIVLPYPPLIAIVSVKYDDQAGVEQTLVENTDFKVYRGGPLGRSAIVPVPGRVWPSTRGIEDSVRIRFDCGYPAPAPDADPVVLETLPAPIKAYLKLTIGTLYANRDSAVSARDQVAMLPAEIVERMISTFRVYS